MQAKITSYIPAWWLPSPHLQATWANMLRSLVRLPYRREFLDTPDGDFLVLDHFSLEGPEAGRPTPDPGAAPTPHMLLLHGLEGSSFAMYIQRLARHALQRGWRVTALNFRTCAVDPEVPTRTLLQRRPSFYHAGDIEDLESVVTTLERRDPAAPLVAVGVSLGGNILLNWMGRSSSARSLAAAATLAVPYDLTAGLEYLHSGIRWLYVQSFLRTLRPKVLGILERFPEITGRFDIEAIRRAKTGFELDDAFTAPCHGYKDARDYYEKSSSINVLGQIPVPTLCINAEDDPFLPMQSLDVFRQRAGSNLELLTTPYGGHVGFVSGFPWSPSYWAEERIMEWLEARFAPASQLELRIAA